MTEAELVKRLERLERDNRRLKRLGAAALVLAAALGAIAATRPVPQKITAHEFDVVDGSGKVRVSLNVQDVKGEDTAGVRVFDSKGAIAATMLSDNVLGPEILLGFHKAHSVAGGPPPGSLTPAIAFTDSPVMGPDVIFSRGGAVGPMVQMGVKVSGQPFIALDDSTGKERAAMGLLPSGAPTIELNDPQGYRMDMGSTGTVTPTTGATQYTSADSIIMFGNDKKHHVIWKAP